MNEDSLVYKEITEIRKDVKSILQRVSALEAKIVIFGGLAGALGAIVIKYFIT